MMVTVDRDVYVTMPDDVRLAADVFRPVGSSRVPVVVLRTPYDRRGAAAYGLQIDALRLAEAGYAVVTQDVRGRFGSEGRFRPFLDEAADGVATIEWAARQPWSDGRVAMAGMSYCGYAQVLVARERPEPLRAWIPVCCPFDVRDGWVTEGDAFQYAFALAWFLPSVAARDRGTPEPARVLREFDAWHDLVGNGLAAAPAFAATDAAQAYREFLERLDDADWWSQMRGRGAGDHDAAALVVGGWYDLFRSGTFALYDHLVAGAASSVGLLVGPWDHAPTPFPSWSGDVEFGTGAALDLPRLEIRWLDHVLRDGDPPFPKPVRTFVTGSRQWREWDAWPPAASSLVLHTTDRGSLDEVLPPAGETSFNLDPSDPTPSVGGGAYPRPRTVRSGPVDQSARRARPDVVSFETEPLERDLLLAGRVSATIIAATGGGDADAAVTLVDVDSGGLALNVADGIRRIRATHRGEPTTFEVDLGQIAHLARRGHRIGIDVAGAAFPRFDLAASAGVTTRRVLHGATGSRLRLPIAV